MNTMTYIMIACMMTMVVSLPLKQSDLSEEYEKCGQTLVPFINYICLKGNMTINISGNSIKYREVLLKECCLVRCSAIQLIKSFCPTQSFDTDAMKDNYFVQQGSETDNKDVLPPGSYTPTILSMIRREFWRFMIGGTYE